MKHRTEQPKECVNPAELRELLERLHGEAEPEPEGDHTTVQSVCEATGESEQRVWEVLEAIRAEDLEARISRRLTEVEEPLYRVERPGQTKDPLGSNTWIGRHLARSSVLDQLPKPNRQRVNPTQKRQLDTSQDRISKWMSILLLLLMLATLALIVVRALEKGSI